MLLSISQQNQPCFKWLFFNSLFQCAIFRLASTFFHTNSSLCVAFAFRRAECSGIGDPVFAPVVDRGGGIHLPLMVVFCFRLMPTRSHFPPKRANAPVPIPRVVVVQRAVGIDVADVVGVRRIRRNKMYPKRFTLSHDPAFSTWLTYTSHQAQV